MNNTPREPARSITAITTQFEIFPEVSGHTFKAIADFSELDDRFRPGPKWTGRALRLSKSHLVFQSRRMCHKDRTIAAAIHRIDSDPVPLVGTVSQCVYSSDGMYAAVLDFIARPDSPEFHAWLAGVAKSLAKAA